MIWYARGAFLLPLVVPAVAYAVRTLGFSDPTPISGLLAGSILVGGVPYVAFASLGLVLLWNHEPRDYLRWAMRAPVVFIPFLLIFLLMSELLGPIRNPLELFDTFVFIFCLGIPIGYAYVGLFGLGWWLISRVKARSYGIDAV